LRLRDGCDYFYHPVTAVGTEGNHERTGILANSERRKANGGAREGQNRDAKPLILLVLALNVRPAVSKLLGP
jgi:hypothetical protein